MGLSYSQQANIPVGADFKWAPGTGHSPLPQHRSQHLSPDLGVNRDGVLVTSAHVTSSPPRSCSGLSCPLEEQGMEGGGIGTLVLTRLC